ncbi:hypothetical protein F2Q69_00035513 [Brassica cretica]|uniref:Uncharacterized protein n=1 Tax=Brassica cretica TaxID=69181 RepID=A0A8S9STZ7_BRACR|nr:hypothetical protein F2Q69_00035513 [Brassica cretica]
MADLMKCIERSDAPPQQPKVQTSKRKKSKRKRCDIENAKNTKCLKPSLRLSTENFDLEILGEERIFIAY